MRHWRQLGPNGPSPPCECAGAQLCPVPITERMKQAIQHRGFALIDIFSPCVTFNKDNDNPFFKQRVHRLEDENHDTSDQTAAMETAVEWGDTIYTGLFYQGYDSSALGDREPVLDRGRPMGLSDDQAQKIIAGMM